MNGTKAVAQRIVNAEEQFIGWAQGAAQCTRQEAEKILAVYRNENLVKIDPVGGQFTLKHGVFAEADVLRNAMAVEAIAS
mgnify:CR=1 FL=1